MRQLIIAHCYKIVNIYKKENVNKMFNEIEEITKDIPLYPKENIRLNKYKS